MPVEEKGYITIGTTVKADYEVGADFRGLRKTTLETIGIAEVDVGGVEEFDQFIIPSFKILAIAMISLVGFPSPSRIV